MNLRKPPVIARYQVRKDPLGWTVFDVWTGMPVVVQGTATVALGAEEADHLAALMTQGAAAGVRKIFQ